MVFSFEFLFLLVLNAQRLPKRGNMCHVIFCRKSLVYQKIGFYWAFFLLVLILSSQLAAQNPGKIDSLKEELRLRGDANRYKVLWGLAYELFDVDNQQALGYAQMAYDFGTKRGDSLAIVESGRIMGQLFRRLHRLDESINILQKVLSISKRKGFEREEIHILNGLAIAYSFKAEYDKALEYNFQSLVIREQQGNKMQIGISLNNIGFVYFKMNNYDLGLDYFLQALNTINESGDKYDLDRLYINIGLCYNGLADYTNAQDSFNKAFEVCEGPCSKDIVIEGEYGLGHSFFNQKNYMEAKKHLKKSLEVAVQEQNQRFQLENLIELAEIDLIQGNLKSVSLYLEETEKLASNIEYKSLLLGIYRLRAAYHTALGNFEFANSFQRKYSQLRDSIYADRVIKNLTRVQTLYAQRENLAIIAAKDEVLALNDKVISQQRAVTLLLVAVLVLMGTLGVVIYRNYRKIKEVNAELASAKQVIEDHNKFLDQLVAQKTRELIDTNVSLVKVNDELDNFIYKTSHDIRGPLASLKGMVNLAIMDVKDEKALGYLSKLDTTAEKLNMVLTRLLIVNRINNTELKPEQIHFEPIIQEILTLEVKKGIPSKIKIDFEVESDIDLVTDREMVRLILENLIDNAVKFYNDSERVESFVRIGVKSERGGVTARIVDNGVGITTMNREKIFQMFVRASERSDTGGIGLYLAKLATEKLGGEINLVSTDEKYTEFIVQFPTVMPGLEEKKMDEFQPQPAKAPIGKQIA